MGKAVARGFRQDQAGASIVEFALLAPVLLAVFVGSVTAFDLFRNVQNVEKATFTIGDMLSRQSLVTPTTLKDMGDLMQHMVLTASDGGIRVSSFVMKNGRFEQVWSEKRGENVPTTPLPVDILPNIAEGDTVLLTESFVPHEAIVASFGFSDIVLQGRAVHRPRFMTAIPFVK